METNPQRTNNEITLDAIEITQNTTSFHIAKIRADLLTQISYASIRGIDREDGAVQRILNNRRISSIKDYVLSVGHFPSSIILNWRSEKIRGVSPQHTVLTRA